jgi:hypothetical protein
MTLVSFYGKRHSYRREPLLLARRRSSKLRRCTVVEKVGMQTGWIHLGDATIAFVFPVPILPAGEPESANVTAPKTTSPA